MCVRFEVNKINFIQYFLKVYGNWILKSDTKGVIINAQVINKTASKQEHGMTVYSQNTSYFVI